jgi:hypothetical protein
MRLRHRLAILFGVVSVLLGTIAVRSVLTADEFRGRPLDQVPALREALKEAGIDLDTLEPEAREGVLICVRERLWPSVFGDLPAVEGVVPPTMARRVMEVAKKVETERFERWAAEDRGRFLYFPAAIASLLARVLAGTRWYRALHPRWSVPVVAVASMVGGAVGLVWPRTGADATAAMLFLVLGSAAIVGWLLWFFRHRIK